MGNPQKPQDSIEKTLKKLKTVVLEVFCRILTALVQTSSERVRDRNFVCKSVTQPVLERKKLKIQHKNLKKLKTLVWEVRYRILTAAVPDMISGR